MNSVSKRQTSHRNIQLNRCSIESTKLETQSCLLANCRLIRIGVDFLAANRNIMFEATSANVGSTGIEKGLNEIERPGAVTVKGEGRITDCKVSFGPASSREVNLDQNVSLRANLSLPLVFIFQPLLCVIRPNPATVSLWADRVHRRGLLAVLSPGLIEFRQSRCQGNRLGGGRVVSSQDGQIQPSSGGIETLQWSRGLDLAVLRRRLAHPDRGTDVWLLPRHLDRRNAKLRAAIYFFYG
jgi:hypothetical protein